MNVPGLRSPYDTIGGIVYFGRMLDKIRLHGERKLPADYHDHLGKGFDLRCCNFLRVQYDRVVAREKLGGTEEDILAWCFEQGRKPSEEEVETWNDFMRKRGWRDSGNERLRQRLKESGFDHRTDIQTMFDYLDADEGRPPRATG